MSATQPSPAPAPDTTSPTDMARSSVSGIQMMLDIETFSVEKDALVLSAGIVLFDPQAVPGTIIDAWHSAIHLESQGGGTSNLDTIFWWLGQPEAAKALLELRKSRHCSPEGLGNVIARMAHTHNVRHFWGNSPDFDFGIVGNMLQRKGIEPVWKFYQLRDFRTMKDALGHLVQFPERTGAHDALADAKYQAHCLQLMLQAIP